MKRLSTGVLVGLVVLVVGTIGAGWAWERQSNAEAWTGNRREAIERAAESEGFESAAIYGIGYAQPDGDSWRAAALVLATIAVMGGCSAAAIAVRDSRSI